MLKKTYSPFEIIPISSAANKISRTVSGEAHITITAIKQQKKISNSSPKGNHNYTKQRKNSLSLQVEGKHL